MRHVVLVAVLALAACKSGRDAPAPDTGEAELDRIVRDLEPVSDRLAAVAEIADLSTAKREIDRLLVEHAALARRVDAIRASSVVSADARAAAERLATELATTRKLLDDISRDIPSTTEKP